MTAAAPATAQRPGGAHRRGHHRVRPPQQQEARSTTTAGSTAAAMAAATAAAAASAATRKQRQRRRRRRQRWRTRTRRRRRQAATAAARRAAASRRGTSACWPPSSATSRHPPCPRRRAARPTVALCRRRCARAGGGARERQRSFHHTALHAHSSSGLAVRRPSRGAAPGHDADPRGALLALSDAPPAGHGHALQLVVRTAATRRTTEAPPHEGTPIRAPAPATSPPSPSWGAAVRSAAQRGAAQAWRSVARSSPGREPSRAAAPINRGRGSGVGHDGPHGGGGSGGGSGARIGSVGGGGSGGAATEPRAAATEPRAARATVPMVYGGRGGSTLARGVHSGSIPRAAVTAAAEAGASVAAEAAAAARQPSRGSNHGRDHFLRLQRHGRPRAPRQFQWRQRRRSDGAGRGTRRGHLCLRPRRRRVQQRSGGAEGGTRSGRHGLRPPRRRPSVSRPRRRHHPRARRSRRRQRRARGDGRGNSGGTAAEQKTVSTAVTTAYGLSGNATPAHKNDRGSRSVVNGRGSGGGGGDAHRGGVGGSDRGGRGTVDGSAVGGNSALGVSIGADGEPTGVAVSSAPASAVRAAPFRRAASPSPAAAASRASGEERTQGAGPGPRPGHGRRSGCRCGGTAPRRCRQVRSRDGSNYARCKGRAWRRARPTRLPSWHGSRGSERRTSQTSSRRRSTRCWCGSSSWAPLPQGAATRHPPRPSPHRGRQRAAGANQAAPRYSILELETLWKEVDKLLRKGVIEPASSPWSFHCCWCPSPTAACASCRTCEQSTARSRTTTADVQRTATRSHGPQRCTRRSIAQCTSPRQTRSTASGSESRGVLIHHRVPDALGAVSVARRHHGPHADARHLPTPHGASHRARRAVGLRPCLHRRRLGVQPHLRRAHGAGGARVHSASSSKSGAQAVKVPLRAAAGALPWPHRAQRGPRRGSGKGGGREQTGAAAQHGPGAVLPADGLIHPEYIHTSATSPSRSTRRCARTPLGSSATTWRRHGSCCRRRYARHRCWHTALLWAQRDACQQRTCRLQRPLPHMRPR